MPILLNPDQALTLDSVLADANTQGLEWHIDAAPGAIMPKVRGIANLATALAQEISFLTNPKYSEHLATTQAAAVIVTPDVAEDLAQQQPAPSYPRVVCKHPYLLYARLAQWFDQARQPQKPACVHPSAVVAPDAVIEADVHIAAQCVIESGARIGRGSVIGPACVIGAGSILGPDCRLNARVTLYENVHIGARAILHSGVVLGADGFGYAPDPSLGRGAWGKIPQFGRVLLGDDVEIGANTTVDRGALDDTVLGDGVKLDNQIMIGHNARVGDHTAMAACVGVAGSTVIGKRCTIAGAAMLSGHLMLADDVHVSGGTAVTSNITKPGRYTGVYPYAEHADWQRNAAVLSQLATLRRRLRALEQK